MMHEQIKTGDLVRVKYLNGGKDGRYGRSQDVAVVICSHRQTNSVYVLTSQMIIVHKNVIAFELLAVAR